MTTRQMQHFLHMVLRNAERMAKRAQDHGEASRMINSVTHKAKRLGFSMSDRHNTAERLMGCVRIIERAFNVRLAVLSPLDEERAVDRSDWVGEPY